MLTESHPYKVYHFPLNVYCKVIFNVITSIVGVFVTADVL